MYTVEFYETADGKSELWDQERRTVNHENLE